MENKKRTDLEKCVIHYKGNYYLKTDVGYKKIILTTDQDLIKDGVQEIPDEFLEWFVKNPTCEFVIVKSDGCRVNRGQCDCSEQDIDCQCFGYKIITPKEKQKQLLSEMMQEDEKSGLYDETIEEAAKNFYPVETNDLICSPKLVRDAFLAGALWQQKQMYSKQQVLELMKQSFEAGFKKADIVEAGLEPKETKQEVNWILLKYKKRINGKNTN